jgi:hypothetical protein
VFVIVNAITGFVKTIDTAVAEINIINHDNAPWLSLIVCVIFVVAGLGASHKTCSECGQASSMKRTGNRWQDTATHKALEQWRCKFCGHYETGNVLPIDNSDSHTG